MASDACDRQHDPGDKPLRCELQIKFDLYYKCNTNKQHGGAASVGWQDRRTGPRARSSSVAPRACVVFTHHAEFGDGAAAWCA